METILQDLIHRPVVIAETEAQITPVQGTGDSKMKGIFFLAVFGIGLMALNGCYTIPRHYATQEIIIYYPVPVEPEPTYGGPHPLPVPVPKPPSTDVIRPDRNPIPPKDDGSSYSKRDPLQGGDHRGSGETKTDPPVRNPVQKDRDRQ